MLPAETAALWEAPALDGAADQGFLTAARLQELQQQAYDEAYAEGLQAGRKEGASEVARHANRLEELVNALVTPFDELDEAVTEQLVTLSILVVKQLFRREIRIDPTHIIGVVREALQLLPVAARNVEVCLHPEDARIVREALSSAESERAWKIVEDPLISRGGCQVRSADSRIDAEVESRLRAAVSAIAGDERKSRPSTTESSESSPAEPAE